MATHQAECVGEPEQLQLAVADDGTTSLIITKRMMFQFEWTIMAIDERENEG